MDDELARLYSRWRAADHTDRDDEADAAFRALSEALLAEPAVPLEFTARTTDAIARAMAVDARRARRSRKALVWGGGVAAIGATYFGAGPALSVFSTALVVALDLVIRSIVWVSTGPNLSVWSALNGVGRASAAFIADPKVTVIMFTIQATAIAAFVALRRLLGSDREFLE